MSENITGIRIAVPIDGLTIVEPVTIARGESGTTLEGLQDAVGGYVDCIDVHHPETDSIASFWFHDEGKILGLEPNYLATFFAVAFGFRFMPGDVIAGSVVLTGFEPDTGETVSLPPEWLDALRQVANG